MVWHRGRTRSGAPRGDADPEARASSFSSSSSSSSSSLRLAELLPARPDAETDSARLGDYRLVPDAPSPRGHPRDPRGGLVSPTSANAEGWRVDAPVRLRGRLARGRPDVVLELFRVESLPERPAGAPTRGSDWTRTSAGGGVGDPAARVVDVAETALVLACVDAADPRGLGGRAVFVAAAAGAARVAASAIRARRTRGDEVGPDEAAVRVPRARAFAHASASASASARLAAVAARACEGALALYVSGAALRVVNPEWHATARRAAALAAVRVAFASPPRARAAKKPAAADARPDPGRIRGAGAGAGPAGPAGPASVPGGVGTSPGPPRGAPPDFDARAWHARYRWAALRLMDLVPTRPAPPAARRVFAFLGGVALNVAAGRREDARAGNGREDAAFANARLGDAGRWFEGAPGGSPLGGDLRSARAARLDVSWVATRGGGSLGARGRGARRRRGRGGRWAGAPWRVREGGHGEDLVVAGVDLDRVATGDVLAPPPPEPPSAATTPTPSPEKKKRIRRRADANESSEADANYGSEADANDRSEADATGAEADAGSSEGAHESAASRDSAGARGDIWRDARFAGRDAGYAETSVRAAYLAVAFAPVFFVAAPLLFLAECRAFGRGVGGEGAAPPHVFSSASRSFLRRRAFLILHFCVSLCGAALVKWAQWASVRRDIFPEDFCDAMSALHDDAPRHSRRETERAIRRELGVPSDRVFAHFPALPVASGSIAQVYRCVLRPEVATACAARDPELARRLREQARDEEEDGSDGSGGGGEGGRGGGSPARASAGVAPRVLGAQAHGLAAGSRRRRGGAFGFFFGAAAAAAAASSRDGGSSADALLSSLSSSARRSFASRCVVAVKVRHPGVDRQIFLDFRILKRFARFLTRRVPSLAHLNLEETLGQFSHTMTAQTDLRVEARNLRRFGRNFRRASAEVCAPWPVPGLVTEGLLCETFERGDALSGAIRRGSPHNPATCALGVDTYLKMLLRDNFLHSDLHPGNILYRLARRRGGRDGIDRRRAVKLVLLDFGIADELPPEVRDRFLTFLFALVRQDGVAAADCVLGWSSAQTCVGAEAEALRADMKALVDERCALRRESVDIDDVLKRVMGLLRRRGVSVDAVYASLVVSLCVLVGFATSLDEHLNLFEVAVAAFLSYSVTGDVVGKLYES